MPTARAALLRTLMGELIHAERSAHDEAQSEWERLGDVPPGCAMRAIADHTAVAARELRAIGERDGLFDSIKRKRRIGSWLRALIGQLVLDFEHSYRGTLLGLRNGLDLLELVQEVAFAERHRGLAVACARLAQERKPLVDACTDALPWFVVHPARAADPVRSGGVAHGVRAVTELARQLAPERQRQDVA